MTIRQISRSGADTLLRVTGLLFWVIRTGGLLALFAEGLKWVAQLAPMNARQVVFDLGLVLLGWSVSRLCTLGRSSLKERDRGAEFSTQSTG